MTFREILDYSVGSVTVGKILSAVVTFAVCCIIIKCLMKLFNKIVEKTNLDGTLKKYLKNAIKVLLYFVTAMIVVDTLGISVTSLVAAFSVVGLAASLAVQNVLANFASGIMLIVSKPFKAGDYISADSTEGTVASISLIHTKLVTIDNKMIFIPNGKLTTDKIINYTAQQKRRVDLEFSASYDSAIDEVRTALLDAVKDTGLFLDTPRAPFAAVMSYDESSIKYVVRAWTKTKDYWDAYFGLTENVKKEFDKHNIEMTYNHINVHMIEK